MADIETIDTRNRDVNCLYREQNKGQNYSKNRTIIFFKFYSN